LAQGIGLFHTLSLQLSVCLAMTAIIARDNSANAPASAPCGSDEPGTSTAAVAFSRGSALHSSGACEPCAWFWRPGGCKNAEECGRCHLCPEGEIKARKKKKVAMMKLGLITPKNAPASGDLDEPWKVSFNMTSPLSAAVGVEPMTPSSPGPEAAAPMKVSLRGTSTDGSTTSGSELEEEVSAGSPGCSAGEEEGPMAACSSGFEVRLPPGLQAPPGTPSHGSVLHRSGNCWPCASFWIASGCPSGQDCRYCHLCPARSLQVQKKSKRAMLRLGLATPKASNFEGKVTDFQM